MKLRQHGTKIWASVATLVALGFIVTACTEDQTTGGNPGTDIANERTNYTPQNDVEGHNYNARQRIADNPATIIWCTAYPTSPNAQAFTIPIVGKLTSGNKRPYPTEVTKIDSDTSGVDYNPELPGPDGMYGSSGEYRYGFDPAGNYHDFYNIETYCTTVPNILQKETTFIVIGRDGDLAAMDAQAEAALAACQPTGVDAQGKPLGRDPSVPCDAAAAALGMS